MNPSTTELPLQRTPTQPPGHSGRRRVYLDTYAQKRGAANSVQATPPAPVQYAVSQDAASINTGTAMPMYAPSPTVQQMNYSVPAAAPSSQHPQSATAIPVQAPHQVAPQQPRVAEQTAPRQPQSTQDFLQQVSSGHATYLDTISRRPAQPMQAMQPQAPISPAPVIAEQPNLAVQQAPVPETPHQAVNTAPQPADHIEANLRALYLDEASLTQALMKDDQSASLSHMRTIVASAFACGVIAVSMFTFLSQSSSQPVVAQPVGAPVIEVEAPVTQQPANNAAAPTTETRRVAVNPNHPVRLVIGGIGVNAPIEAVGQTSEGLMAVPKSYGIVGWYSKGMYPGQKGPAVMAGHYTGGYGGVFDRLTDLKDGDLITTTNGKGESFTYKVIKKAEYQKDQVPMAELFKTSDESRLEIITCSGKWQANNYDKRLVVTAELVR